SWLVSQGAGHCQPYVNPRITLVLGLVRFFSDPLTRSDRIGYHKLSPSFTAGRGLKLQILENAAKSIAGSNPAV
ncbi:MAG: hypothetical protein WBX00_17245, partial [Isosphaeraceae bacterium]